MNTSGLLNNWPDILDAGIGQVGGKGWNLARLARYGLPVAEAVVIPATQERQWLGDSGLLPQLRTAAECVAQAPDRLVLLRQQLIAHAMPDELVALLENELVNRGWQQQPLAVRSSATAEDSSLHSFAGIHLSQLNIVGAEALALAVREVWASLWSPAAVAYRQRIGLDHAEVAMAVVIMPLLPARASGIAFTCDPNTGREDHIVIHANWGLGESLVGGMTRGDEILLDEEPLDDSLRVVNYHCGEKSVMSVPVSGGTRAVDTPSEQSGQRVLDNVACLSLGRLVRDAALALNFVEPYFDLEWVRDDQRFWLVQARPVTAKARNTYPALVNQADIWTRGNTGEVLPMPLSAADWFSVRRLINRLLEQPLKRVGYPLLDGVQHAGLFNGRVYLNASRMQWENYDAWGLSPRDCNALMGGHQPEIALPPPSWRERVQRAWRIVHYLRVAGRIRGDREQVLKNAFDTAAEWRRHPIPTDGQEYVQRLHIQIRALRSAESLFFLQASSGAGIYRLIQLIEKYLPNEGPALAAALLSDGIPSVTAQQAYELLELAQLAASDAITVSWLRNPARDNDWQQLPANNPFRVAFADFLERYGHRSVYESYLRNPRWREAPDYLLDTMVGLLDTDIDMMRKNRLQAATAAKQRVKQALPFWVQPMLQSLVRAAQRESRDREAARSAMTALHEPLRNTLLIIGQDRQRQGVLQHTDDIFHLTPPEICAALDGEISLSGLANRVADRSRLLSSWEAMDAGEVIVATTNHQPGGMVKQQEQESDADGFKGMTVSTGRARGMARILRSPREGHRLNNGDILVASSSDPGWTPLFLKAGALVMETGGYLSHGAIVAREFGIPAVVNLPGILERIKEGELLEVDGYRGVVVRLHN